MTYQIDLIEFPGMPVASIRRRVPAGRVAQSIAEFINEVALYLEAIEVRQRGAPFTRFHNFEPDWVDLEAGLPIPHAVPEHGRVETSYLPEGPALTTFHEGPYEGLPAAGEALEDWASANSWASVGPSWEFYWVSPGNQSDPDSWRTEVVKPVRPSIVTLN